MINNKIFVVVGLLVTLVFLPAVADAQTYLLTLSTWGTPKHPQVASFVPEFVQQVKKLSHGQVRVRTFNGGEMVKEQNVATAIPQDTVDISLTTLDSWSGRIPQATIFASPLWTWTMQRAQKDLVPGKPLFEYFNKKFKRINTVLLAMFDDGPPVLVSSFKVTKPEDLKGKTIRVYSKGLGEVMQAFGANPTAINVGEVYSALQRGTVDGAMGGLAGAVGLKYYQEGTHMLAPNGAFGTLMNGYVMSKQKFDSLPPHIQHVIRVAAAAAREKAQQALISSYDKLLKQVADHGIQVITIKHDTKRWAAWRSAEAKLIKADKQSYPPALMHIVGYQGN